MKKLKFKGKIACLKIKRGFILIVLGCVGFSHYASAQWLPLAGGIVKGTIIANNLVSVGGTHDFAAAGTLVTNGTNYNGGALGRNISSFTELSISQYLTVDLGPEACPGASLISFGTHWNGDGRYLPAAYHIEYSMDNTNYTGLISVTNNTPSANPQFGFVCHAITVSARYWRLTVDQLQANIPSCHISAFQILSNSSGSATGNLWNTTYNTPFIFSNSDVGIGTSRPDAKLAVNGMIHAREVRVDLNFPAPDYVFDKYYPLLPIEQLERYISARHHLPDIPPASQMAKDGISLSEMNMKMLRKLEELTLYVIDQNKRLKVQEEALKTLKRRK